MPQAERVRLVKLAGEQRYLARSRTVEPGSYYELTVNPWGRISCSCPGFTYRRRCAHAEALQLRQDEERRRMRLGADELFARIRRNHS
jgi:hypothetical protein